MSHEKKISDFLIDSKIDRMAKQRVSVLESGGSIIWVVGMRISDHVKVTGETKRVTVFRWSRTGQEKL
jgi:tRNA(Ile)-lysidine synthase